MDHVEHHRSGLDWRESVPYVQSARRAAERNWRREVSSASMEPTPPTGVQPLTRTSPRLHRFKLRVLGGGGGKSNRSPAPPPPPPKPLPPAGHVEVNPSSELFSLIDFYSSRFNFVREEHRRDRLTRRPVALPQVQPQPEHHLEHPRQVQLYHTLKARLHGRESASSSSSGSESPSGDDVAGPSKRRMHRQRRRRRRRRQKLGDHKLSSGSDLHLNMQRVASRIDILNRLKHLRRRAHQGAAAGAATSSSSTNYDMHSLGAQEQAILDAHQHPDTDHIIAEALSNRERAAARKAGASKRSSPKSILARRQKASSARDAERDAAVLKRLRASGLDVDEDAIASVLRRPDAARHHLSLWNGDASATSAFYSESRHMSSHAEHMRSANSQLRRKLALMGATGSKKRGRAQKQSSGGDSLLFMGDDNLPPPRDPFSNSEFISHQRATLPQKALRAQQPPPDADNASAAVPAAVDVAMVMPKGATVEPVRRLTTANRWAFFNGDLDDVQLADVVASAQERERVKDVLWYFYAPLLDIFNAYSAASGHASQVGFIGLQTFIQFCRNTKLMGGPITVTYLDQLFLRVNLEEQFVEDDLVDPSQAGAGAAAHRTKAMVLVDDPDNPDNLFTRSEWMEAIVRIALVKFASGRAGSGKKIVKLPTAAHKVLYVLRHHVCKLGRSFWHTPMRNRIRSRTVAAVYRQHHRGLFQLYTRLSRRRAQIPGGGRYIYLQEYTEWLRDRRLLGPNLSRRHAMMSFALSRDLNLGDNYVLAFPSFCELLARLAAQLFKPKISGLSRQLQQLCIVVLKP